MTCNLYKTSVVTAINTKTGEKVYVDECYSRSIYKRRELAIKILRGRQWAEENGYGRSQEIKFNYDLPDDEPFPHELSQFKEKYNDKENQ